MTKLKEKALTRREFLAYSIKSISALGLLHLIDACAPEKELSFLDARNDYRRRQSYIDQVVGLNTPPQRTPVTYRHDIVYQSIPYLLGRIARMETSFTLPGDSSDVKELRIQIYRSAFEDLVSEDEFLSGLVDHEYVHARHALGGIEVQMPIEAAPEFQPRILDVDGDLSMIFLELEAYLNQIKLFPNRSRIRESFRNETADSYMFIRSLVEKKERTPLISWMLERYPRTP